MINEVLLVLSEFLLSAYPLLIKLVDASILFQTGLRMGLYSLLASIALAASGSPSISLASLFSFETILVGLMNLMHVGSSYTAFDQLAGGNAMALFYTYPVWNILGAAAMFQETIPIMSIPWIGLSLIGAIMLAQPSSSNWTALGVLAALMAALTETGIYLWFRRSNTKDDQPWPKMIQMYGSSSLLWCAAVAIALVIGLIQANVFNVSMPGLLSILAFNSIIGFVGYALRFYIVPKVSTIVFSSLSFIGVFAAYGLGWLFTNETPNTMQLLGALAIIVSNTVLMRREIV